MNVLWVFFVRLLGGVYGFGFFGECVVEIDIWGYFGFYGGF